MGRQTAELLQTAVASSKSKPSGILAATVGGSVFKVRHYPVGIVTLIVTASGVFGEMQARAYETSCKDRGVRQRDPARATHNVIHLMNGRKCAIPDRNDCRSEDGFTALGQVAFGRKG